MQWWIAAAGLALLFVFFLSTRKKPFFPRRESFSEETLSAGMAALAEQKLSRRRVRLLLPASERSALEKTSDFWIGCRRMNCCPRPAASVRTAAICRRKPPLCKPL